MSVFKGIKGTFQSVQQDIVDGFKALTSFESQTKGETLKRLQGDGVSLDAGADLLYRYHTSWKEIDSYSRESAKRAEKVDEDINGIYKKWSKQEILIKELEESVTHIPVLLEVLSNLTASIELLEDSFREVEEGLERLEDVCEEQELVKQKQNQAQILQQYKHSKSKEIEKVKVQMARDHAKRMMELEKDKSKILKERHEAFDEAFSSDISFYKRHGKTDKLFLPDIPKVSSLSDITIDQDEKALNDFLASQTTTPIADKTSVEEIPDEDTVVSTVQVVVTEEDSFIEDDYTKDYGREINTLADSDSSDENPSIQKDQNDNDKDKSRDEMQGSGNQSHENENVENDCDKVDSKEISKDDNCNKEENSKSGEEKKATVHETNCDKLDNQRILISEGISDALQEKVEDRNEVKDQSNCDKEKNEVTTNCDNVGKEEQSKLESDT